MNYLAHLFLSPPDEESRLGNIMADFLRDVIRSELPLPVQKGIMLHHRIDGFTDHHPVVRDLRALFSPQRRRFSGVVLDVVFDHFLIQNWDKFTDQDMDEFIDECYGDLLRQRKLMPERMDRVITWMTRHDWIRSYKHLSGIERALDGLAGRLKMDHGFHGSIEEVKEHHAAIEAGFMRFFPELVAYAEEQQKCIERDTSVH